MSSLVDVIFKELKKTFPEATIEAQGNILNIVITEDDLKRIFQEYATKSGRGLMLPAFDVKIINNRIILSFRVI